AGLDSIAETPLLASVVTEPVVADAGTVEAIVGSVDTDAPPVAGLRQLVAAVGDSEPLVRSARRLAAAARFFREERAKVEQAASYLTHPQLEIPEDEERLRQLRDEANRLVRDALELA